MGVKESLNQLSGIASLSFPITTWPKSKQFCYEHFFLINATIKAVNRLEKMMYYQGSHIVKNYLDGFQTLISEASYTDPYIIVVKFCHKLWITIQN